MTMNRVQKKIKICRQSSLYCCTFQKRNIGRGKLTEEFIKCESGSFIVKDYKKHTKQVQNKANFNKDGNTVDKHRVYYLKASMKCDLYTRYFNFHLLKYISII